MPESYLGDMKEKMSQYNFENQDEADYWTSHEPEQEPKDCPKCGKKMREWFDSQVLTGFSCDDCGHFENLIRKQ